jgi:hypothetical protein
LDISFSTVGSPGRTSPARPVRANP